jgi:exodeoxyribonuclease V alpha subunit
MDTIRGTLENIIYINEDSGFVVASVLAEGEGDELITVVGNLPTANVGEYLAMRGRWVIHQDYGRQFRIDTYEPLLPPTLVGMKKYLGSGLIKGVGPVFAERIVNIFGERAFEVIEERPEELMKVPGIGETRVERIRQAWQEQREIKNLMVFLQSHGVSVGLGVRIYKRYGNAAVNVIRENPYQLAEDVWGIGFKTADKIAQNLGIAPDAPGRLQSGIEYALHRKSDEGHVYVPKDELLASAAELLGVDAMVLPPALEALIGKRRAVSDAERVYLAPLYFAEMGVANRLRLLLNTPPVPHNPDALAKHLSGIECELGITFAENQRNAVVVAVGNAVLCLTGGPGTGKTTTVRGILALFRRLGMRVALAAPTGRAAKRMAELTGEEAKTIHRLLGFSPLEGGFTVNAENPLDVDALIVDEMSMVDIVLLHNLLKAVRTGAHVVFVGDVDQLPSVGPGNALKDIIASGTVPVVALTEIFRQARNSLIITNAHRINRGDRPVLSGDKDRDFFFIESEEPEAARDVILELCSKRLPQHYGFDPMRDIQVLTPMRRGFLGAEQLNDRLQKALNPHGNPLPRGGRDFRIGDRVMQIVNNYEKDVFNGDIGRIAAVEPVEGSLTVAFPDKSVAYDLLDLSELVLAYAVTVHKSQGSEYPAVVLALHTQHYLMLQRNLLYTAVTRAKRLVVIVGTKRALDIAVRNDRVARRYSALTDRLANPTLTVSLPTRTLLR